MNRRAFLGLGVAAAVAPKAMLAAPKPKVAAGLAAWMPATVPDGTPFFGIYRSVSNAHFDTLKAYMERTLAVQQRRLEELYL